MRRKKLLFGLLLSTLLLLVLLALSQGVAAYEEYTDNENPGQAKWIETPRTMGPVHLWKTQASTNTDWWRFNASGGDHIEIAFRKYTLDPTIPGLPGYTYYIKWSLRGPYQSTTYVYDYDYTYPGQGQPREHHRRDTFSYVVPENLGGNFFIRIYVDPPPQNPYRDHAFYFMNVTVTTPPSMDSVQRYDGMMGMHSNYDIDFNFDDYYTIDLTAVQGSGDFVTVTLTKAASDPDIFVEAWEVIPFGTGGNQNSHMCNRSWAGSGTTLRIEFTADHTGMYYIRVYRDFYSVGDTAYSVAVMVQNRGLDGNNQADNPTQVLRASTLRREYLEMGYDTHDWYACQIKAGDRLFGVVVDLTDPNIDDGHGFEMVVFRGDGQHMWSVQNRVLSGQDYTWRTRMELPPPGTTTIFEEDDWYYVRVSVDPTITSSGVTGMRVQYDVEFKLSNRAPTMVTPFEDLYQWDEDGSVSIELDSHFDDVDGDDIEYTIFNKTPSFAYDVNALTYDGYLNITSPPDWNGEVWWRLMAIDEGQSSDTHKIYVILKLRVTPVDDRPVSNGTLSVECDEEGTTFAELSMVFYDVDEGPGGVLTFGWNDTGSAVVAVALDSGTGTMTFTPAVDVFGTFTFDVWCHDDILEYVTGQVALTVDPVNDAPRIMAPIPRVDMEEGDPPVEMDLSGYFYDVDGDDLLYTWTLQSELAVDMNVYHKNNVVTESRIVIELLDPYFYAVVTLNITCTDEAGTFVKQDLRIVIVNVPNAPTISYDPQSNPEPIDEGDSLTFRVVDVVDPDVPEFGLHTYAWYVDDVLVADLNDSVYLFTTDYEDAGPHTVRVEVSDPTGLGPAVDPSWAFLVRDVNRGPSLTLPVIPDVMREDQKLMVSIVVDDPDGDELTISWYRIGKTEDKLLDTGRVVSLTLPPGKNTIEVVVEDGTAEPVTERFDVTVEEVEEASNLGLIIGIVVIIVVVVVVALALMMRKKGPRISAEARMDLDAIEKDMEQYKDYSDYDPTPKDWEGYDRLE